MMLKIAAVTFVIGVLALLQMASAKAEETFAPATPFIPSDEMVFICDEHLHLDNIILIGLSLKPEENEACGLIAAGELTFIGSREATYELLTGEGNEVGVGIYTVQACNRTYAIAWPYNLDPHLVDAEAAEDSGDVPLLHAGYPKGTCERPSPASRPAASIVAASDQLEEN